MVNERNPYAPPQAEVLVPPRYVRPLGHRILYGVLGLEILVLGMVSFFLFAPGLYRQMRDGIIPFSTFAAQLGLEIVQLAASVALSVRSDRLKPWLALGTCLLMICRLELSLHTFLQMKLLSPVLVNASSLGMLLLIAAYALMVYRD